MTTVLPSSEKRSFPVLSPNSHRGERSSGSSTPNQHPYAIKTTSTALLTRSNSSGYAASHQHFYVPTTPSPASRHRHSKSDLSRPAPRPLPIPPSSDSPSKERKVQGYFSSEEVLFPTLRARAETLPSAATLPPPSPVKVDELPSNPRVWTTSQLASYLITALRVKSGESLPLPMPVAKDIAAFVKEARLNGRAFLRLNEQDLETMGINNLWREALLNASRNLRQNVLKGRIWGFEADEPNEPSPSRLYRISNSSSSSVEEFAGSQDSTPLNKGGDRKGRVRGLIASLERTSSIGSGRSNHGSSTSEGEALLGAWADDEAAFASGSEASEVEDRKARAITKKRLRPELTAPTANVLQGLSESANVASPEAEPSVEELLDSGPMSGSWGAKAWEDMKVGETVKRISPDNNDLPDNHDGTPGRSGDSSRSGSGKISDNLNGSARKQVADIFNHPLPTRPLPSPPRSEVHLLEPQKIYSNVQIVEKVDAGIQADLGMIDLVDKGQDVSLASEVEAAKLEQALSLLELFRQRLAEVEDKLSVLERKDAEQAHVEHQSRGIATDAITTSVTAPISVPAPSSTSRSVQSDFIQTPAKETPCSELKSTQAEGSRDPALDSLSLPLISQHSPSSADGTNNLVPTRSDDKLEWQDHLDGHDWDPLENGIPSYVLMVGFGVCAVVLSTILKRLAGKKT